MSAYEELVERVAVAVRKDQITRTSSGRAFDPEVPPSDSEVANARAAVAEVLRTLEKEAHEIEDDYVRDGLEEWLHDSPLAPSK